MGVYCIGCWFNNLEGMSEDVLDKKFAILHEDEKYGQVLVTCLSSDDDDDMYNLVIRFFYEGLIITVDYLLPDALKAREAFIKHQSDIYCRDFLDQAMGGFFDDEKL